MKKLSLALAAVFFLSAGFVVGEEFLTNLDEAIELAQKEQKMLFIKYGRESCGNCRNLDSLIKERKVRLPSSQFIVVDLDCDSPKGKAAFRGRYREAFVGAKTLPFVVVAKADGTLLASRSSGGTANDYNDLIREARKKANR